MGHGGSELLRLSKSWLLAGYMRLLSIQTLPSIFDALLFARYNNQRIKKYWECLVTNPLEGMDGE